jgi:hypothetical protein
MMVAPSAETDPSAAEETLVVVELPPEARALPDTTLEFTGLGTRHPRVRLPNGVELVGRYEESVGSLLIMNKSPETGVTLAGKSETRLIFAPTERKHRRRPRSGR